LRVSTDQQDVDNQRYGVLVYANTRGLGPLQGSDPYRLAQAAHC
jgi:hypothetical protein